MASTTRQVVLITGANQGIGLELARTFAAREFTTILTSRDAQKGESAAELLKSEGLHVDYHQLDVTDPQSVRELASWLHALGGLDILVNNAGCTGFSGTATAVNMVLETNYYGTKLVTEALLPLIRPGGRIVNVSSMAGDLSLLNNDWASKLDDVNNGLTTEAIEAMLADYRKALEAGQLAQQGWPALEIAGKRLGESHAYCISKLALNAYSRMLARELAAQGKGVTVNCACPGGTSTSLTGFKGHPPEIGADTPFWLATAPQELLGSGRFFVARTDVGFRGIPLNMFGKLLRADEVASFLAKMGYKVELSVTS